MLLMTVEIRGFLAVDSFSRKSGTVLAFAWMLARAHPPSKLLIPNAKHLESDAPA